MKKPRNLMKKPRRVQRRQEPAPAKLPQYFQNLKIQKAVEGLPPSETATKVNALENELQDVVTGSGSHKDGSIDLRMFGIARDQVRELALAFAESLNLIAGYKVQSLKYQDFVRVTGDPQHLSAFLRENFRADYTKYAAEHLTQIEMVKRIMTDLKLKLESR